MLQQTTEIRRSIGDRHIILTKASFHQVYGGNPSRGDPGAEVTVLAISSSMVNAFTRAFARDTGSAAVLQTGLSFNGPFAQSRKAASTVCETAAEAANILLYEKRRIVEWSWGEHWRRAS